MKSNSAPAAVAPLAAFLFAWLLWAPEGAADTVALAPSGQRPTTCELLLEGKFIQSLTLVDRRGQQTQFARPGSTVSLPPGEYRVSQVDLAGGVDGYRHVARREDWFWVAPDEPYTLRLGAPLVPNLKVRRQGTQLQLDFELLDAGGRPYAPRQTANPARFTIYYNGREIASDAFRYG